MNQYPATDRNLCKFSAKPTPQQKSIHPKARRKVQGLIIIAGLHHVPASQI